MLINLGRKIRRREDALEVIRRRIRPFPSDLNEFVATVVRAHVPEPKYMIFDGCTPEQGEDISFLVLDGKYVMTIEVPHGLDVSIDDVLVEKEDAGEYCRANGKHYQWLWAAVQEMRTRIEHDSAVPDEDLN